MHGDPRNIWQKSGWLTLQVIAVLTVLTAIGLTIRFLHVRWTWYGGQWNNPVPPNAQGLSDLFFDHQLDAVYNLTPFVAMLLVAVVAWWIGSMKRRFWYWPTPTWRRRCIALSTISGVGILAILIYLSIQSYSIFKESQALQALDPNGPNHVGMMVTGVKEWRLESFVWWSLSTTVLLTITFGLLASYSRPRQSGACNACNHLLSSGQTTCPECGARQHALQEGRATRKSVQFSGGLVASPHQSNRKPTGPASSPNRAP